MKNMTKKSSFFNTFSAGLILSCLGTNVFKCDASASSTIQEAAGDGESKPAAASASLGVLSLPENGILPHPPTLPPIDIPWEKIRESEQTFWAELVSLSEKDAGRDVRINQGNDAFSEVVDLVSLFEDHDYKGIDLKTALSKRECKFKFILGDDEFEIQGVNNILLKALNHWRPLQECFFSLNQSVLLLRRRILEDYKLKMAAYEREIQLIAQFSALKTMEKSFEQKARERKEKLEKSKEAVLTLQKEKETLVQENALLKSQISKSEEVSTALATENSRLKAELAQLNKPIVTVIDIPPTTTVTSNRKTGFWAWVKSWFIKDTGENKRLLDREN